MSEFISLNLLICTIIYNYIFFISDQYYCLPLCKIIALTFEDLNINKPLLQALAELDFVYPTAIQKESYARVMSGRDLVGIAQTGTGKTFAYLLPLLRMWKFSKEFAPTVAILVPTRELVVQVEEEAKKLALFMNIRIYGVYGGANINVQSKAIYEGLDIIIGTPGRIMDLALNGALKLKKVKSVVIDEVDEMLSLGLRVQLENIFELLPKRRQNIMFSATMTPEVERIIDDYFDLPDKVVIAPSGSPLSQISLSYYNVLNFYTKINLLSHLLKTDDTMEKVLVFVESKRLADLIFEKLSPEFNESIDVIHSNKSQNHRFRSVNGFADGTYRILIATDIIARGLDIEGVSHVINMDTPSVPELFMHRVGRTGRADKKGIAITFTTHKEMDDLAAIEALMQKNIDEVAFPSAVEESTHFIEEEKETFFQKNYFVEKKLKNSGGAFHEKLAKNVKVNAGGYAKKRAIKTKSLGKKYRNTR